MATKTCRNCGREVVGRHGSAKYCSDKCGQAVRYKRHYASHSEHFAAKRSRDNSDWPRKVLSQTKSRAKKAGIPFDLELADVAVPTHCPVLGHEMVRKTGGNMCSASLDRLVPALGYVRGNVRVISRRANLLKSNMTLDEVRALLAYMEAAA